MDHTLARQIKSLLSSEDWYITNLANGSALLMQEMEDINWAGFYLAQGNELVLGPFQGKAACTHIPLGKGVCGTAAIENKTLRVEETRLFRGHIACDCNTRSEIVVPLHDEAGAVIGVMDIDSTTVGRFSKEDQSILEETARVIEKVLAPAIKKDEK